MNCYYHFRSMYLAIKEIKLFYSKNIILVNDVEAFHLHIIVVVDGVEFHSIGHLPHADNDNNIYHYVGIPYNSTNINAKTRDDDFTRLSQFVHIKRRNIKVNNKNNR